MRATCCTVLTLLNLFNLIKCRHSFCFLNLLYFLVYCAPSLVLFPTSFPSPDCTTFMMFLLFRLPFMFGILQRFLHFFISLFHESTKATISENIMFDLLNAVYRFSMQCLVTAPALQNHGIKAYIWRIDITPRTLNSPV